MDWVVFIVSAVAVLAGAIGVVTSRNPVHAALMLVLTLFGIAILFVEQQAHFLAVVQVIVYAGAIVVLFLFVIMLLGVDTAENLETEPLTGQRTAAIVVGLLALAELFLLAHNQWVSGQASVVGPARGGTDANVDRLAKVIFSRFLLPFEATSVLLVIAVVGAVVLARRPLRQEQAGRDPEGGPA
jgi:NADH-quinone oxidoreductase subunit J